MDPGALNPDFYAQEGKPNQEHDIDSLPLLCRKDAGGPVREGACGKLSSHAAEQTRGLAVGKRDSGRGKGRPPGKGRKGMQQDYGWV